MEFKASEENGSDSSQGTCSGSPDSAATTPEDPQEMRHWLVNKLFSIIKYVLFGAFVLACNKLRRYIKVHRLRLNSSSSSSSNDVIDVSKLCSTNL